MVWHSNVLKNFPQFIVIYTVRGFGIINKAEVDVFFVFSCFLMIQSMLEIWPLVLLPFLNPAWMSGSSRFTYCRGLTWRILSITLLACEMSAIVQQFEHSLTFPFFGIGMKTDLFQSCGHCWVFQICWHIECSTFTCVKAYGKSLYLPTLLWTLNCSKNSLFKKGNRIEKKLLPFILKKPTLKNKDIIVSFICYFLFKMTISRAI